MGLMPNSHSFEAGFTFLIPLIAGAILITGASVGAYFLANSLNHPSQKAPIGNQKTSQAISSSTPAPQASVKIPQCKFDENICRYLKGTEGTSSALTRIDISQNADGSTDKTVWKYDTKGNFQITIYKNDQELLGTILFNKVTYIKQGGEWEQRPNDHSLSPSGPDLNDPQYQQSWLNAKYSTEIKYTFLGKEPCGSRTCFKYKSTQDSFNPPLEVLIWFDDQEYLVRKDSSSGTTTEYDYSPVVIVPPANYKVIQ